MEQKPTDAFARYGLAMEYAKSGNLEKAVAEFRKVVEIDPGYAYAYFYGGQTLEKLGRVEDARGLYRKKGISMPPRSCGARWIFSPFESVWWNRNRRTHLRAMGSLWRTGSPAIWNRRSPNSGRSSKSIQVTPTSTFTVGHAAAELQGALDLLPL